MRWTGCKRELSERLPALLQTTRAQGLEIKRSRFNNTPPGGPAQMKIDQRRHICLTSTYDCIGPTLLQMAGDTQRIIPKFVLLVPIHHRSGRTVGAVVPSERSYRRPGPSEQKEMS